MPEACFLPSIFHFSTWLPCGIGAPLRKQSPSPGYMSLPRKDLPIRPEIPVPVDVPEDGISWFWSFIIFIQADNLIGRLVIHPTNIDVSCIPAKTGSPYGIAKIGIVLSGAKHFHTANLFE
jgi:hypothetical protein